MRHPQGFDVLLVVADGRRVLRLSLPRWVTWTALAGVALALLGGTFALGALSGNYPSLRGERESAESLRSRLRERQATLERYRRGMADIRVEIGTWRDLHAKIWAPFGPEGGSAGETTGMGGRTVPTSPEGARRGEDVREELARLSRTVDEEAEQLRALERFLSRATRMLAALPSRWPVRGPVNSDFGDRRSPWAPTIEFHSGIDIGAVVGTPVLAPGPGTVVFAGRHPEFGVAVLIDHGQATTSLYGHLSRLNVEADQRVERGGLIGWSGNTGRSSGPHLHYEVQVKGQPVNPRTFLWD